MSLLPGVPEATGIHGLSIPTPFAVGRVNCWLIDDDPLTLVDCGPNSGLALDELEQDLAALGRRVEDLGRVVITHQHMDHLGLIGVVRRRSGAEVCALAGLAPLIENWGAYADADDEMAAALMIRHGVPQDIATALRSLVRLVRGWSGTSPVDRRLHDGEWLEFGSGRRMQALHRPGHSPSDTVLWDPERRVLIGGDHLIGHISSNPVVARPLPGEDGSPPPAGERPKALLIYMASLRRTRAMDVAVVLPGHGEPVRGHAALIDDRFAMHDRRARRIRRLIAEAPLTAHEIAAALWGDVALTQVYLTLSEVLGHVDLLVERGQAVEADDGGVTRFAAA